MRMEAVAFMMVGTDPWEGGAERKIAVSTKPP